MVDDVFLSLSPTFRDITEVSHFPQSPIFIVRFRKSDHSSYPRNVGDMDMEMKEISPAPAPWWDEQADIRLWEAPSVIYTDSRLCYCQQLTVAHMTPLTVDGFGDLTGGGGQQKRSRCQDQTVSLPFTPRFSCHCAWDQHRQLITEGKRTEDLLPFRILGR